MDVRLIKLSRIFPPIIMGLFCHTINAQIIPDSKISQSSPVNVFKAYNKPISRLIFRDDVCGVYTGLIATNRYQGAPNLHYKWTGVCVDGMAHGDGVRTTYMEIKPILDNGINIVNVNSQLFQNSISGVNVEKLPTIGNGGKLIILSVSKGVYLDGLWMESSDSFSLSMGYILDKDQRKISTDFKMPDWSTEITSHLSASVGIWNNELKVRKVLYRQSSKAISGVISGTDADSQSDDDWVDLDK